MDQNAQIGPYTIQQLIGSGGMADVYLAWDHASRWPVALKVLRAKPGKDARLQKRSERESAALMKLRHPHIVQLYGSGQAPDGRYYIAMEYIGGGDLDDLMRRKSGNKLPVTEAVYLMRRVAGAIAYAHEQGVIHRDLKPGNILIRADSGEPVITDLGIAALAGANPLTGTMESLGTPQYMAPEQVANRGPAANPADGRADVYAIGVMLFELLTGRLPFEGENNWAILFQKQQDAAPSVLTLRRDLDPRLAAVVDACLQRDPAHRYQTAAALAAALDAFLPLDARPPAPVLPKGRKVPSTPRTPSGAKPATGGKPTTGGKPATGAGRGGAATLLWIGGAALVLLLLFLFFRPPPSGGGEPPATVIGETDVTSEAELPGGGTPSPGGPTSTLMRGVSQATDTRTPTPEGEGQTISRTPTRRTSRANTSSTTATVKRDVYTRAGPGTNYDALGSLGRNETVTVTGRDYSGWYLVRSSRGQAWVWKDYITVASGSLAAIPIVTPVATPVDSEQTGTDVTTTPLSSVTPSLLPPIALLDPPLAVCPPNASAPVYPAKNTIIFRWKWPAMPPAGAYMEVRAGAVGAIISKGRVDPQIHLQGDVWSFPVSGNAIFVDGDGAYQWAVYLVGESGVPLLNSPVSCFGLDGGGTTQGGTVTPSDTDSDGDGVVDSLDQCPGEHQGDNPDPGRPGCPAQKEPDSDGDGVADWYDFCPGVPQGPYPDPYNPGCPGPTPYPYP